MTDLLDPTASNRLQLGLLIRDLRQTAGLTRNQLGDAINMNATDIRLLEMGRIRISRARWDRLTAALPDLEARVTEEQIQALLVGAKPL